jgi:alkylated DNA repair dioxygenase AlkB
MINDQFQSQLLPVSTINLDLPDSDINYQAQFIDAGQAATLFDLLLRETQWRQEQITLFGKTHAVPRLSCWMGDIGTDYSYSNMTMTPVVWSDNVLRIKQQIEAASACSFNSVLINYYRDGQDSNGWHSDNEPELGQNPVIASLSLGADRDFQLRHKTNKALRQSICLQHGSLLIMRGATQRCWQHHVPKRAKAQARINLTFRTVLSL